MSFSGKVMPKMVSSDAGPYPLSQEQLQFYRDNGYIVIKRLYDTPTLNLFRDRFTEICSSPSARRFYSIVKDLRLVKDGAKPEMYVNKIQELLDDEVYMKYSEDPKLLHIVSQLIGEDLTAFNCMLINKPPGSLRHPPHQDLFYFPVRPADRILASWTAMDRVCPDNGCLYVIPGSHKIESLYLHGDVAAVRNQFYHSILKEDVAAPLDKRVNLEMEPGDTVFFHSYLVHGSGPNTSQHCRKAMTVHFANSNCHYIDVRGTAQEGFAEAAEKEIQRRGGNFSFIDVWRIKKKQLKGVKSNL